jgi:hypothetical protein
MGRPKLTLDQRLAIRFIPLAPSKCWPWRGYIGRAGYGNLAVGDAKKGTARKFYAHRLIYTLYVGPIPKGMFVCHRCDNPICVNPNHLFLGTQQDNIRDMWAKGRHPLLDGEKHYAHKLTALQVRAIRKSPTSVMNKTLAERYGVDSSTISLARRGKNWKGLK